MSTAKIFQIFHNPKTKKQLDAGFIPLDNSKNERPDWYEFWVIRNFLLNKKLEEDHWYGFLSPNFLNKTGVRSKAVHDLLRKADGLCDVVIIPYAWDQISYFLNCFEQGEFWHPGLVHSSEEFFRASGIDLDLKHYVGSTQNTVLSNFVFGKRNYWEKWLSLANLLFGYFECGEVTSSKQTGALTTYGSAENLAPMKAFIQERLASVVLASENFRVLAADISGNLPIYDRLFPDNPRTRRLLHTCDILKQEYCSSRDVGYLEMYRKIRDLVPVRGGG
ncbi:MAG: hypothetical protein ACRET7_07175 [Burkholderiales bacterium]